MRRSQFLISFLAPLTAAIALAQPPPEDDRIYDEVRRKLANDPEVKGGMFKVEVNGGVVTVEGTVEKEKFKAKAERLIKKVKGVKSVVNKIAVQPVR